MLKFKKLTKINHDGTIALVKKDIDFDMFSPAIAKVISDALEQLNDFENKAEKEQLLEIPYPIGMTIQINVNNEFINAKVIGYEIYTKEMIIILSINELTVRINLKNAVKSIKMNGSMIG